MRSALSFSRSDPCSPRSAPRRWSGLLSKIRPLRWWPSLWRGAFLASALAATAFNLIGERETWLALTLPTPSPLIRYERLVASARWYPLDRNLRWAPEEFRQMVAALVADQLSRGRDK